MGAVLSPSTANKIGFKNFSLTFNRVGFERLGNGRMLNPYKNKDK